MSGFARRLQQGAGGAIPIFGNYKPDAATTGYNGRYAPAVTLVPSSGDITVTVDGTVLQGLDISGQVIVQAANVTIASCRVRGNSTLSTNSALIDCSSAAAQNVLIQDCLLVPDFPSVWWDGVIGHDYTVRRCETYNVVDSFGAYNTHNSNGPLNVVIEGNYAHDFYYFTPDSNHSDNHTHNDFVQIQGGSGTSTNPSVVIVGNNAQCFCSSSVGNGPTQCAYYPAVTGQCITLSPAASLGPISGVVCTRNWLHGGSRAFVAVQQSQPASDVGTFKDNFIGTDSYFYLNPSPPKAVVQLDNTLTADDTSGNVSDPGGTAVTAAYVPVGTG